MGRFLKLKPLVTQPFAWASMLNQNKQLAVKIGTQIHRINIDKAMGKTEIQTGTQLYVVEIRVTANAKRIRIGYRDNKSGTSNNKRVQAEYLTNLLKKTQGREMMVSVDMRGMSLSFVDEKPQELLLLTIYDVRVRLFKWYEPREDRSGVFEKNTKLKFQMQHL